MSGGAVFLLPFSIISNEILLSFPKNYYIQWLNGSLIHGQYISHVTCTFVSWHIYDHIPLPIHMLFIGLFHGYIKLLALNNNFLTSRRSTRGCELLNSPPGGVRVHDLQNSTKPCQNTLKSSAKLHRYLKKSLTNVLWLKVYLVFFFFSTTTCSNLWLFLQACGTWCHCSPTCVCSSWCPLRISSWSPRASQDPKRWGVSRHPEWRRVIIIKIHTTQKLFGYVSRAD